MSGLRERLAAAIVGHADHMEGYTLPALQTGFMEGYGHALRLLRRDAGFIAQKALAEDETPATPEECTCGEFADTSVRYADCPVHGQPATPDWRERAEYLEELAEALDDLVMSKGVALDEERLDWLTDWIADRLAAARRDTTDAALAPVEAALLQGGQTAAIRCRAALAAIAEGRDAAKGDAS